ncbi:hypothetical protein SU60_17155 [Vibrio mytili]|uniref:Uncharacterized protein n=1 Tax=Vibrio mytili TaxID=50718 RepID=A0A0C3I699_9VIBR|nr:hypothetical protein SU60_17155 [Vibrio mytili]
MPKKSEYRVLIGLSWLAYFQRLEARTQSIVVAAPANQVNLPQADYCYIFWIYIFKLWSATVGLGGVFTSLSLCSTEHAVFKYTALSSVACLQ